MKRFNRFIASVVFLLGTASVRADGVTVEQNAVSTLFEDLNTVSESPWENWQLEKADWERYEEIVANTPWGTWEHSATPLQILAIYARTYEEKRRYARIEARLDQWREDAVTKYQQIYNDEREIVFARYRELVRGQAPTLENIRIGEHVALFTRPGDCTARCTAVTQRLLKSGAKIDVYVIGAQSDEAIYSWARSAAIPTERVHAGHITLNYNEGLFEDVSNLPATLADLPAAYSVRRGQFERLAL